MTMRSFCSQSEARNFFHVYYYKQNKSSFDNEMTQEKMLMVFLQRQSQSGNCDVYKTLFIDYNQV